MHHQRCHPAGARWRQRFEQEGRRIMANRKLSILSWALGGIVAVTLLAGCGKQDDAITQAAKKDAAAGVPAPGIAEVKAIAEEGFIYGLPIVMNYAVMYEYRGGQELGPVQGPVQPDLQRGPRLHLRGHGDHHAQQRHALLVAVDGPARRAAGAVGAGGRQEALLLGDADRRQHLQLRLHRQPRHRQ